MHVRILSARYAALDVLEERAVASRKMFVQKGKGFVDNGSNLTVAAGARQPGERQQDKRMVVGIAQRIGDRSVGGQGMNVARRSVGRPVFVQHQLEGAQRQRQTLPKPSE